MLKEKFSKYLQSERNYSENTRIAYLNDLENLFSFIEENMGWSIFEPLGASKTDHRQLRSWMGALLESGISKRTVSRKLAAASTYFKFLRKSGVVDANPVSRLTAPKFEKKLPSFLREEDALNLFEKVIFDDSWEGKRDKAILEVLYGCGLRRAEVINLLYRNIDFSRQTLKVMGKGRRERVLPFGSNMRSAFLDYKKACDTEDINYKENFFVNQNSEALDPRNVYAMVRKAISQVSSVSKKSPHVLRHTFATHLLNAGADLNAIKELLGHKSLAATQVYVHNSIAKLKSVHKKAHPKA